MSILRYLDRLKRMDYLISAMATGTPEEFAEKIGLGRSTLFQYLLEMKKMGLDIRYSNFRQSYYYADGKRIRLIIENTDPDKAERELILLRSDN